MSTYPMEPVDAAWYHMDGPANLAMVTAVALTKQPLDFERVREVYRLRLAGFDRFRQRVVETGFPLPTPHWQDMPHFNIDQHLHRIALPAPHDMTTLKVLFNDIASMPLDREQPLWHVHIVENVCGGSAMILRYHHCIGDGTAMQAVVRKLFDATPDVPLTGVPGEGDTAAAAQVPANILFGFDTLERAERGAFALALGTVDALAHPQRTLEKLGVVLGGAGVLLSELAKPADPKSPFKGEFGLRKHVAWSTPVAIADVKAIGAPLGAKVNDVLVAAMAGALRVYLKGRGVDVNQTTVRAMVPVDLRPPERIGQLGNEFGLVLLELPVAASKATDRLAQTKARMDRLKHSPEPVAMKFLFEIFGRGPKAIEDIANSIFGSKASVVMTNVIGPQSTVYLAGVPVDQIMFWVPHPGKELGVGISILSYRGMASLAVIADAGLVPDPEAITGEFNREFSRMRRAAQRAPAVAEAGKPPRKRDTTRTAKRRQVMPPAH